MTWNSILPEWSELADRSAAELLDQGGALFEELADAADSADERHATQARRLYLITTELNERAARLAPPRNGKCACGETFATTDDLDEHFMEVFTPADDIAPDGRLHVEV